MTMLILQAWFLLMLAFVVGAGIAWLMVRLQFRPVDKVRTELAEQAEGVSS